MWGTYLRTEVLYRYLHCWGSHAETSPWDKKRGSPAYTADRRRNLHSGLVEHGNLH
jgi:hypothetical protein